MQRFLLSFFAATLLAGTFMFLLLQGSYLNTGPYTFEVTLHSSVNGTAQLFYNIGRGIREKDSVSLPVLQSESPQVYRFPLPRGYYRSLRFDLLDRADSRRRSRRVIKDCET